ncbi:MAG: PAS domain S-box protein [Deltaproteobacteria bacterium]|nr:PAS domain S-box protein [Deltaproteobacteria bacterium]
MTETKTPQTDLSDQSTYSGQILRQRAEKRLKKQSPAQGAKTPEEAGPLLHELQVHQIELEIQNEELRRTQEELEASRARYFDLYDLAPVGYLSLNEQGLILEANLTAAGLLGLGKSVLVKRRFTEFIFKVDQDIFYLCSKQLLKTEARQVCELRMVKKDETIFWARLEAATAQGADGVPLRRVVMSDITEIKQAGEVLQQSRLAAIIDSSDDAIISKTLNGEIISWNRGAEKIYGYTAEEVVGQSISILAPNDRIDEVPAILQRISRGEEVKHYETLRRRKNGQSIHISLTVSAIRDPSGKIIGASTIARDITQRKQLEEDLLESKRQLRILASQILFAQENERKRIAQEVHDILGSSLSAIKFKAEEALHHLPKDEALNISKPLEALVPLVQETIKAARRIQGDLRPPHLDDLGIVATLSWYCRRLETIYSAIKVECVVTIREEEVPDHLKITLFRIIQEALNNISKHAQADSVYVGLQKVDGAMELIIRDNGDGFDPETLSSKKNLKKGLGFFSMKKRVEFSGGSISIESTKGKGVVIRALWPL